MNSDVDDLDQQLVNFPVPRRYLSVVVRALAEAMSADSAPPPTSPQPTNDSHEWSQPQIARLKREVHNPTVLALLNLTAERAEQEAKNSWVSLDEIQQKAGRVQRQAQGDLAGFTQLVKRRFGKTGGQESWPVMVEWGTTSGEPTRYRMPRVIAQWWKEV